MTDETVTEVEVELPASEPTELEVDTSADHRKLPSVTKLKEEPPKLKSG